MSDEEIIAARQVYERKVWHIFGETLLSMTDMRAARLAFNDQAGALRDALPPEVLVTLRLPEA